MLPLSEWHVFNPCDRKTYPKVAAPIQVRFDDGQTEEGDSEKYFPRGKLLASSSISAWRYIKDTY
jgi:hypothetical protein